MSRIMKTVKRWPIQSQRIYKKNFCLFGLMYSVPVNSYGHVGTLPPFHGTFTVSAPLFSLH